MSKILQSPEIITINAVRYECCRQDCVFSPSIYAELPLVEDLEIEYADNVLTVSSKNSDPFKDSKEPEYVHKGISARQFTKKFSLADDVIVNDASMKNGMLTISMEKIVPDGKKKRSIKIVSE